MEYLPKDMYPIMFSYLTQRELLNMKLVNKNMKKLVKKYIYTTDFYKVIIEDDEHDCFFRIKKMMVDDLIISYKHITIFERIDTWYLLQAAAHIGDMKIVKFLVEKQKETGLSHCLTPRVLKNHKELTYYLMDKMLEIEKEKNITRKNERLGLYWNTGLTSACKIDDDELCNIMIKNGANKCNNCNINEYKHKFTNYNYTSILIPLVGCPLNCGLRC